MTYMSTGPNYPIYPTTEDLKDENNHCIGKDDPYIEVRYFEKKTNSEFKKGNIVYECLPKPVYVHPAPSA